MNDNDFQKIQEYLRKNNIQSDSNENISLNKNQLLECFQMLQNSKNQEKNNLPNFEKNNSPNFEKNTINPKENFPKTKQPKELKNKKINDF